MSFDRFRRREPSRWHNPEAAVNPPAQIYKDGCYIISEAGDTATWAICFQGNWGVVYEYEGDQILSAWVDVDDIPLHVLVEALHGGTT